MTTIKLGRNLIRSLNGKNYDLKRSNEGYYVDGVWVDRIPNQTRPIDFDFTVGTLQTLLREVVGLSQAIVTEVTPTSFSINFGVTGPQSLLLVQGSTLDTDAVVTRTGAGTESVNETQLLSFDDEPTEGRFSLSLGTPAPVGLAKVFGSLQPLGGEDLERLPAGDRQRARKKIYSADFLRSIDEYTTAKADSLVIDGVEWQVESVETWTNFYKAIIVKVERNEAIQG